MKTISSLLIFHLNEKTYCRRWLTTGTSADRKVIFKTIKWLLSLLHDSTNLNMEIAKLWQLSALDLYDMIFKRSDEFYQICMERS